MSSIKDFTQESTGLRGGIDLWFRVGVTVPVTEQELKVLMDDESAQATELLRSILTSGRAKLDGETYSPDSVFPYKELNFDFKGSGQCDIFKCK